MCGSCLAHNEHKWGYPIPGEKCPCGDEAVIFGDDDGPVDPPLCSDCWFFEYTMKGDNTPDEGIIGMQSIMDNG